MIAVLMYNQTFGEFAKIRGTFEKCIFGREPPIAGLVTLGLVELANCLKSRRRASYSSSRTHSSASSHCCAPFLRGIMNRHTTVMAVSELPRQCLTCLRSKPLWHCSQIVLLRVLAINYTSVQTDVASKYKRLCLRFSWPVMAILVPTLNSLPAAATQRIVVR